MKGGQSDQGLAPEAMERTLAALKEFAAVISHNKPDAVRAVGTEALRSAANGREFCSQVLTKTGLTLEIIDGHEESLLSAAGALAGIGTLPDYVLIFDIGGGSTEFILVCSGEIVFAKSCQLGVVSLTELNLKPEDRLKQIQATITDLYSAVSPVIHQLGITIDAITLIGTAGTATTLAAMDMQMVDYDWRRVNGYSLKIKTIESIYNQLADLTPVEREMLPGMEKGRGDLIPAGIEITLGIMRQFHAEKLTISDFGLLEGILLKMPAFSDPKR